MADLNDPILAAFVRDVVRPAAEEASALEANTDFVMDQYTTVIVPMLAGVQDADVIIEGRGNDGVPELTAGEMADIMDGINRIRRANTTAQRRQILRGRVRLLRAD